jgi:peptide/nickel transport system substrate-binding protein
MHRRRFLTTSAAIAAGSAIAGAPSILRAENEKVLRFVPYADVAVTDPIWTSAYATRTHALLVFDTLFGLDADLKPQPQMVEGYTVENDSKTWTLTLRAGLVFHDGTPVLARDCVASIKRWGVRDAFGQALMAATDDLSAKDDRSFVFRLKRPFPLLPEALARPSAVVAAMMPERLALTDPFKQVPEVIGSGPFSYVASERVPGARHVYAKHMGYVPRPSGTPSFTAGPRVAYLDRVEFTVMPDPATAISALQTGAMDWVEHALFDLVPVLRKNKDITVTVKDKMGLVGQFVMNHTLPPFNNPAIRQVLLKAVSQEDCMTAVAGTEKDLWRTGVGFFNADVQSKNPELQAALNGPKNLDALKKELIAAGYAGEKVVMLAAQDVPRISAVCEVTAETMRKLGMNVDYVAADWGTVVQRRTNRRPTSEGGWNCFVTYWSGFDLASPASNSALRANGDKASPGWPNSPDLEALREKWFLAGSTEDRTTLVEAIQTQAYKDVPFIPTGQVLQPTAFRNSLSGILDSYPLFTNVKKG